MVQQQHRKSFMIRDILFNCSEIVPDNCSDQSSSSFDCNETNCLMRAQCYHEDINEEDEDEDEVEEVEDEEVDVVGEDDEAKMDQGGDDVSSSVDGANCTIYSANGSSNVWPSSANCISCKQTVIRKQSDWSIGCSDSYLGEFVPGDDSDDDDDEMDDNQDEDDEDIDIDSRKKLNCPSNGPSDKSIKSKTINSLKRKMRRNRTVFTELQLMGLERRFDSQKYLSTPDRAELARILGLTQLQVKTWYQNRRMKWKKQVMQGGCPIPPTKPKGRPKKNSIPSLGINFVDATFLCSAAASTVTSTSVASVQPIIQIESTVKKSSSLTTFTKSTDHHHHQSIIHHHHQYHHFGQLTY